MKNIEFESHKLEGEAGSITHDFVRSSSKPESKKVVLIVPGANSDIEMNHVRAVVRQADKRGYHSVVFNPSVPPQQSIRDLEIIDFRSDHALDRTLAVVRELFGDDSEIYAVGFSMGSNFLLRYLGANQ